VLLEALKDSQLRDNALVALSHIGPAAAPALPPLIALLHEEDRSVYPDVLATICPSRLVRCNPMCFTDNPFVVIRVAPSYVRCS